MRRLYSSLAPLLALLVVLTSQQFAIARGQPHAAGQIELCVGTEVIVVSVDENGNPTGPAHICPDVAMAFMAPVALEAPQITQVIHISRAFYEAAQTIETSLVHIEPQARGPPLFV